MFFHRQDWAMVFTSSDRPCDNGGLFSGKFRSSTERGRYPTLGRSCLSILGCLRCTQFCWVGKQANITINMKPSNSPTQGQSNPRKNRLKVAFEPLFPTAYFFSWVGIDFIYETDCKKPNSNQILRKHVVYERDWRSG